MAPSLLLLLAAAAAAVTLGSAEAAASSSSSSSSLLARGWGDYPWQTLDDAKGRGTGVMVVIHKTWCGACKALRPKFAESAALKSAVEETGFALVNLEDDEEPADELYKPDGGYIPRVIFLQPGGGERIAGSGSGNPKYQAFFSDGESIAAALRKAAAAVRGGAEL